MPKTSVLLRSAVGIAAEQDYAHATVTSRAGVQDSMHRFTSFSPKDMPHVFGENLRWDILDVLAAVFLDWLRYVGRKTTQEK